MLELAVIEKAEPTSFKENGFCVCKIDGLKTSLEQLRREYYEISSCVARAKFNKEIKSDQDLISFFKEAQASQFQSYKLAQGCPGLYNVASNPMILETIKSLGVQTPVHELPPQIRCDMPVENQSIFFQHQDYVYNIGSSNSVTVWIPFQDVDKDTGALLCVPGSHDGKIYPNKGGVITQEHKFDFQVCPVRFGEALIFNQKLVHQSGRNVSNKIRFSIQLRFTDASDKDYAEKGFYINHKVTTEKYLGEVA
jgi:phytanoyl-CoA hydroxylase